MSEPICYAVEVERGGHGWTWQCCRGGCIDWSPDDARLEAAAWTQDGYNARVVPLFRAAPTLPPDVRKALYWMCKEMYIESNDDECRSIDTVRAWLAQQEGP